MVAKKKPTKKETAETMAERQRDISVSEFFLKNRHLLGFDSPAKALGTAVKEAVDNSLDAAEEAGILPEIAVELRQISTKRFCMTVIDNGPGIVQAQIPKIFAKLLYGSKFHRLKMSRGQQGIGISAAGMYGQLTTGQATKIISKTKGKKLAHSVHVQIDTRTNKPVLLKEEEVEWCPEFFPYDAVKEREGRAISYSHGTMVSIEMEGSYRRGKLSVDEYIKQTAIVNPHLQLYYRVILEKEAKEMEEQDLDMCWTTFFRVLKHLPDLPTEIKPHPHGVELGILMQMLKDSGSRTLKGALSEDFSRVSGPVAIKICEAAGLNPKAKPTRIAHQESEALFNAIQDVKLMRPPTDCLSPIGEEDMLAGLKKQVDADFYTATTRSPTVYRGNPFQVEVALAYAKPGQEEINADEPVRVMRFANRVPLLYMGGACAMTKSVTGVKWKSYGLNHPRGGMPQGPVVLMLHIASVWVPFTSESKEAIAHYPEIIKELTFALQDVGRKLSIFLSKRKRAMETARKRNYIEMYIPHMALGMAEIIGLDEKNEKKIVEQLTSMLEKTHLDI
ncbi:MAG: DNA topoisomerase-6 subunit B [Kiritimatiellia bacterium]|jgi:DNA topoisomerase-6 subunit B